MALSFQKESTGVISFHPALMWVVAALGVPFQFVLQASLNVMIPGLSHDWQLTQVDIGFLSSSFFYTYLFFQIPAGIVVDRFGARTVLAGSVFLGSLACIQFALSNSVCVGYLSRLLMGFVSAACVPAVMYVTATQFSQKKFVILAGLAESIGMFGGAVGGPILGLIVVCFGWRNTMFLCALLGMLIAICMYLFIRDNSAPCATRENQKLIHILLGFGLALKSAQMWYIAWYGALVFALLPALAGLWVVQILQDLYHLPLEVAAYGPFAMFFGTALGLPCWGFFSERLGRRRPVLFVATGANVVVTASFIYFLHQPLSVIFIKLFLMGFFCAVYVLTFALVKEQTPARIRASAMGLMNMMTMVIGGLFLQPLIGAISTHYRRDAGQHGAYQLALGTVMVCLLLAFVIIFFIKETPLLSQRAKREGIKNKLEIT